MTITVTINPRFRHLSQSRRFSARNGGVGIEKEAVIDIVVDDEDLSSSGTSSNITVDCSAVHFKEVYDLKVNYQSEKANLYFFKPGTSNAGATASLDVIKIADATAQTSSSHTVNLQAIIRGY